MKWAIHMFRWMSVSLNVNVLETFRGYPLKNSKFFRLARADILRAVPACSYIFIMASACHALHSDSHGTLIFIFLTVVRGVRLSRSEIYFCFIASGSQRHERKKSQRLCICSYLKKNKLSFRIQPQVRVLFLFWTK